MDKFKNGKKTIELCYTKKPTMNKMRRIVQITVSSNLSTLLLLGHSLSTYTHMIMKTSSEKL